MATISMNCDRMPTPVGDFLVEKKKYSNVLIVPTSNIRIFSMRSIPVSPVSGETSPGFSVSMAAEV